MIAADAGGPTTGTANRIDRVFQERSGRPALILYITAGHPDIATSTRIAPTVAAAADIIELGIPFSDPVADGAVTQTSSQIALARGTKVRDCLAIAREIRRNVEAPVVLMTYYNPVLHYGLDRFAADAGEAGVDGVDCVDLPAEEAAPLHTALSNRSLHLIPLVAPTSTDERLHLACSIAGGFIYCVSRTGVTGVRESLEMDLPHFLNRVRSCTDLPRAVGFGVSTPEQARNVGKLAEGVIIGSALVALIERTAADELEAAIQGFAGEIRRGLDDGG